MLLGSVGQFSTSRYGLGSWVCLGYAVCWACATSPNVAIPTSTAKQAAEKVSSFVGRAFRHDIESAFPSGVLTPEGAKLHFPATCKSANLVRPASIIANLSG